MATLGTGSKNYYPGPNFDGKEGSKYVVSPNYYYLLGKFGISKELDFKGECQTREVKITTQHLI